MPNVAELPDLGFEWQEQWAVNMKCLNGADAGVEVIFKMSTVGGIQAIAGLLDAVRDRLNGGQHDGKVVPIVLLEKDSYQHGQYGKTWTPVLDDRRLDAVRWSGTGAVASASAADGATQRLPSSRAAAASVTRDAHLGARPTAATSPYFFEENAMFSTSDLNWFDFEVASAVDLKAAGTLRYAADASTRAIVLAYAIGDGPALAWHADGAILDWDYAPDDLRAAFDRGAPFAAWNASFDSAIWNFATLGFPFLEPERVIDRDDSGRRHQSADRS